MANLSHLEILYCRHNRLTTLPTLTNCSNLKVSSIFWILGLGWLTEDL